MKPPLPLLLACAAVLLPGTAGAGTIYVDRDNTAAMDGGGLVFDTTTATVTNCTVSANNADGNGVVDGLDLTEVISNWTQ